MRDFFFKKNAGCFFVFSSDSSVLSPNIEGSFWLPYVFFSFMIHLSIFSWASLAPDDPLANHSRGQEQQWDLSFFGYFIWCFSEINRWNFLQLWHIGVKFAEYFIFSKFLVSSWERSQLIILYYVHPLWVNDESLLWMSPPYFLHLVWIFSYHFCKYSWWQNCPCYHTRQTSMHAF